MSGGLSKILILSAFALLPLCRAWGQASMPDTAPDETSRVYRGFRLSLYNFSVREQDEQSVVLECAVANSGREIVSFNKSKKPTPVLIVELDTFNIPKVLTGQEKSIVEALLKAKVHLMPGQIWQKTELYVPRTAAPQNKPQVKKEEKIPISNQPEFFDYVNGCPDLIFDTLYVKSATQKEVEVVFVLKNIGPKPAILNGSTRKQEDNMAVNVYLNTSTRLTRGALLIDGIFLDNNDLNPDGVLLPGKRLAGEIKLDLRQRNRHLSNLIFEADPFQSILECSKTNNTRSLLLPFVE